MNEFKEMLGRFEVKDNDDGTKNISGVPIFKIGTFKSKSGDQFDKKWFDGARATHEELKAEDGYLPPIFVGHTKDGEEKEAKGFFDNLRLEGKRVIADLVKVPSDFYDKLRGGAFPARSVEAIANKGTSRLLGLAMLGSSTPACKFGPLHAAEHFDGNIEDVEAFEYSNDSEIDAIKDRVSKLEASNMSDEVKTDEVVAPAEEQVVVEEVKEEVSETDAPAVEPVADEFVSKIENNDRSLMEDKIADLEAKIDKMEEANIAAKAEAKKAHVEAFIEKQQLKGALPKSVVQFDGDENGAALRDFMCELSDDQTSKMESFLSSLAPVANMSEKAVSGEEVDEEDDSALLAAKASKYAEEHNVSYKDALIAISK